MPKFTADLFQHEWVHTERLEVEAENQEEAQKLFDEQLKEKDLKVEHRIEVNEVPEEVVEEPEPTVFDADGNIVTDEQLNTAEEPESEQA